VPDAAVRRRGDRWAAVVVAILGLASCAPVAYAVADQTGDEVRRRAAELGAQLDPESTTSLSEQLTTGQGTLQLGAWLIGGAIATALFVARRMLSKRYVAAAMAGRPVRSAALPLSVAMWIALGVAAAASTAVQLATETPTGPTSNPFVEQPWAVLLMPAGVGVAAAFSWWRHRRRWELLPLLSVGIAHVDPPPPDDGGIAQGVWAFTRAAAIESGFVGAAYLQGLISDESPSFGDAAGDWIINVAFLPGVISGMFIVVLLLLPGLRWSVRGALGRPSSVLALVLLFGGYALTSLAEEGSTTATAFGVLMLVGGLIASVTGLGIQDTGPQPWLGLLFLAFVFSASFATAGGSFGLPSGAFAWAVTIVIAALTVREGRLHWRETYRPIRVGPGQLT
jgi:hypothetical protein